MLIVGEVKIRHSGDMGSSSRQRRYTMGFQSRLHPASPLPHCCSEVTAVNEMSASAPGRPDELYKKEHASAAPSAPALAEGKPQRGRGSGGRTFCARGGYIDALFPGKFNWELRGTTSWSRTNCRG